MKNLIVTLYLMLSGIALVIGTLYESQLNWAVWTLALTALFLGLHFVSDKFSKSDGVKIWIWFSHVLAFVISSSTLWLYDHTQSKLFLTATLIIILVTTSITFIASTNSSH